MCHQALSEIWLLRGSPRYRARLTRPFRCRVPLRAAARAEVAQCAPRLELYVLDFASKAFQQPKHFATRGPALVSSSSEDDDKAGQQPQKQRELRSQQKISPTARSSSFVAKLWAILHEESLAQIISWTADG